jgi:hypothetical protein
MGKTDVYADEVKEATNARLLFVPRLHQSRKGAAIRILVIQRPACGEVTSIRGNATRRQGSRAKITTEYTGAGSSDWNIITVLSINLLRDANECAFVAQNAAGHTQTHALGREFRPIRSAPVHVPLKTPDCLICI